MPNPVVEKFYGCGNPIPLGIEGLRVLDLGCGSGRDCYVAAQLVGPHGFVVGVDMTAEQIEVASKYAKEFAIDTLKFPQVNMEFKKGYIEELTGSELKLPKDSFDLVISNCVINLSPNKNAVLQGVYEVLKNGGEFYFSDVYCDRRLPEKVIQDKLLYAECLSGALYIGDFMQMCREIGFIDIRQLSKSEIQVLDAQMKKNLGNAKFYSITYRLFKLPKGRLEWQCEDYGQIAIYKGTIEGHENFYELDQHHGFETNRPQLVCGNTASMLTDTWLSKHFRVIGDRSVHFGVFECSTGSSSAPCVSDNTANGKVSSCCS